MCYGIYNTWRKHQFRNSTGRFFHIHPTPDLAPSDYHLFRSLSSNLRGVSFNNDAELQNWLDFFTAKPEDFFKRGIENLPERWQAVVNIGGEYMIDCLVICVKNKLFKIARTYAQT
jgi:hypothetical protein